MCGVAGFVCAPSVLSGDQRQAIARHMADAMSHRGPDDSGIWAEGDVALSHRRLAVLDPGPRGHQPMVSPSGRYVLVYNGEIYNFRALREALSRRGHSFRGTGDTEVLVAAIEEWGPLEAPGRLAGMFAYAVFDREQRKIFLCRDRAGEKPLYLFRSGTTLVFASELAALRANPLFSARIDRAGLGRYLSLGYVPSPRTLYQDVTKVRPGRTVVVDLDDPGSSSEVAYWSLEKLAGRAAENPFAGSALDAADRLEEVLRTSVRSRLVSDVGVGVLLSGGIDSSVVAALADAELADTIKSFTVSVPDRVHDEATAAAAVARWLGTEHHVLPVDAAMVHAAVADLVSRCGEPVADPAALPTYLVASLARHEVVVVLTGEGADELFGGYARYRTLDRYWRWSRALPDPARRRIARGLGRMVPPGVDGRSEGRGAAASRRLIRGAAEVLAVEDPASLHWRLLRHWDERAVLTDVGTVIDDHSGGDPELAADVSRIARQIDLGTSLPDGLLAKVDQATMAASVEARVPYLAEEVIELVLSFPESLLRRSGADKFVLRSLASRYLPPAVAGRKKKGFGLPLGPWLRGPLRDWAESLLDPRRIRGEELLEPEPVASIWRAHLSGQCDESARLWDILMFEAWMDHQASVTLPMAGPAAGVP